MSERRLALAERHQEHPLLTRTACQAASGRWAIFLGLSTVLLVPCFWHPRIELGDVASHTYNAWLAQLIEHGQAPGLYIVRQWNNVPFDLALLLLGKMLGLRAAEKTIVALWVLIFFWGAFALIAAVTERPPWFLVPAIAMIAYGWTFHMGFMNYYLSVGLSFFALALFWRGTRIDWAIGVLFGCLALVAHPQGFLWLIGAAVYVMIAGKLRGWMRWFWFFLSMVPILVLHFYVMRLRFAYYFPADFYMFNGGDQVAVFGGRYVRLVYFLLIFGPAAFLYGVLREWKQIRWTFRTPLELWALLIFSAAMFPAEIWLPEYSAPIGFPVQRQTTVAAILGLCILGFVRPRKWHLAVLSGCAALFFSWLYQDTGMLNRMEQNAEEITHTLPYARRVLETIWAPSDWNVFFINHLVDRACIGHCFTYSNYEPSAGQFRIRVRAGSPIVTSSAEASNDMEQGDYVVRAEDLPMSEIYQCDERDLTKLCVRELVEGEKNGRIGYRPPR